MTKFLVKHVMTKKVSFLDEVKECFIHKMNSNPGLSCLINLDDFQAISVRDDSGTTLQSFRIMAWPSPVNKPNFLISKNFI